MAGSSPRGGSPTRRPTATAPIRPCRRFPDDKGLAGVRRRVRDVLWLGAVRPESATRAFAFRLATAQSPLGQALFRHYGLDTETFETNLVLIDGRAYAKLDSVTVGGRLSRRPWRGC